MVAIDGSQRSRSKIGIVRTRLTSSRTASCTEIMSVAYCRPRINAVHTSGGITWRPEAKGRADVFSAPALTHDVGGHVMGCRLPYCESAPPHRHDRTYPHSLSVFAERDHPVLSMLCPVTPASSTLGPTRTICMGAPLRRANARLRRAKNAGRRVHFASRGRQIATAHSNVSLIQARFARLMETRSLYGST
jgi:hypothetical protein